MLCLKFAGGLACCAGVWRRAVDVEVLRGEADSCRCFSGGFGPRDMLDQPNSSEVVRSPVESSERSEALITIAHDVGFVSAWDRGNEEA